MAVDGRCRMTIGRLTASTIISLRLRHQYIRIPEIQYISICIVNPKQTTIEVLACMQHPSSLSRRKCSPFSAESAATLPYNVGRAVPQLVTHQLEQQTHLEQRKHQSPFLTSLRVVLQSRTHKRQISPYTSSSYMRTLPPFLEESET